ncbi:hypothetical protein MAPG_02026 [Magnaporthiopsis poae ATCC 64411]|uniref:Uncharacterized protein n=1 Tax=Magnaporthiopsis poae (strain ATCC 64411 / 73-15) TaxID=644358 RepID=A0A0C4DQ88_MAGP6|nr:hypothetical protein MAPG_02026 [Magnaporthiopsis poae ATCC 64411]
MFLSSYLSSWRYPTFCPAARNNLYTLSLLSTALTRHRRKMRASQALGVLLAATPLNAIFQPSILGTQPSLVPSTPENQDGQGLDVPAGVEDGNTLAQNIWHYDWTSGVSPEAAAAAAAPPSTAWLPSLGSLMPEGLAPDAVLISLLPLPPPMGDDEPDDDGQPGDWNDWTRRQRRAWKRYRYLAGWAAKHRRRAAMVLLRLVVVLFPDFIARIILFPLGFGAAGIAAGSVAAWIQSLLGNVVRRSIFAYLQSAAMGGYGISYVAYLVRALVASSFVRDILKVLNMTPSDLEELITIFLSRWLGCALFTRLMCETYCVDCTSASVPRTTTCSEKL